MAQCVVVLMCEDVFRGSTGDLIGLFGPLAYEIRTQVAGWLHATTASGR